MTITADQITNLDEIITSPASTPANAGHPLNRASLPYWQDQPCPAWCVDGAHEDHALPGDRCHLGASREVRLILKAPDVSRIGERLQVIPGSLTAYLDQGWRDREARVVLSHNGATGINFNLNETSELAKTLSELAEEGSARDDRCPIWCVDGPHADSYIEDRNHASEYTMMPLALEYADVSPSSKPLSIGEVPEPVMTLPLIGVRLDQGWREREARVIVVCHDEYTELTLAEARELAEALSGLAADAAV